MLALELHREREERKAVERTNKRLASELERAQRQLSSRMASMIRNAPISASDAGTRGGDRCQHGEHEVKDERHRKKEGEARSVARSRTAHIEQRLLRQQRQLEEYKRSDLRQQEA